MRDVLIVLDSAPSGASHLFFERARTLGLQPMLVCKKPHEHHYLAPFESIRTARLDLPEVLRAIDAFGRERIAGVCTALSQRAELAVRVAQALGLPHCDPEAVAICHDKYLARKKLDAEGIRDAGFELVRSTREAAQAVSRFGGKAVVKPRVSSGSTGVRVCRSAEDAAEHMRKLAEMYPETTRTGVLMEEFIEGPQYVVEMFDAKAIAVGRTHVGLAPASVLTGDDFPPRDGEQNSAEVAAHAERATVAAGHVRGPADVEVRFGPKGPCIVEINPRVAGGLGVQSVLRSTGVDVIEATIRFSCGMPYTLARKTRRAAATRYLVRNGQALREIRGREDALKVPGVAEVRLFPDWYVRTGPARDYRDRVAYVISEADTAAEAVASAEAGLRLLHAVPESGWRNSIRELKHRVWA